METVCTILQENINHTTELQVAYDGMAYWASITDEDEKPIANASGETLSDALENLALKLQPGGSK